MLLNGQEIWNKIEEGALKYADPSKVNSSSIDLALGFDFKTLKGGETIDLTKKEKPSYIDLDLNRDGKIEFKPGMFLLASTREEFNLPNNLTTECKLRSSVARIGIDHFLATWADAGFHGSNLTLEFMNHSTNTYLISPEMYMVQLIFHQHNPVDKEYGYDIKGGYNNNLGTIVSKGVT
jgi:dCTP deaminase